MAHLGVGTTGAPSVKAVLQTVADAGPPLIVVGMGTLEQLNRECGSSERAVHWLCRFAQRIGRPVAIHKPDDDHAQTIMIPPPDWTTERLEGYVAGLHDELEALGGSIARVGRFDG